MASLTTPAGFAGVDGLIRFRGDGVTERALAVLEVQRAGSMLIDPAPAAFNGPVASSAPVNKVN